jgi:hypothetical protein
LKDPALGDFDSILGTDTLAVPAAVEEDLEFMTLFDPGVASSFSAPSEFSGFDRGTSVEELRIVVRTGLLDCSRTSIRDVLEGWLAGMGICSILSREFLSGLVTKIGAGVDFFLLAAKSDNEESEELRLRSCL